MELHASRLEVWSKTRVVPFLPPSEVWRATTTSKHLRNQIVPVSSLTEAPFERLARIDQQSSTSSKIFGQVAHLEVRSPCFGRSTFKPRLGHRLWHDPVTCWQVMLIFYARLHSPFHCNLGRRYSELVLIPTAGGGRLASPPPTKDLALSRWS